MTKHQSTPPSPCHLVTLSPCHPSPLRRLLARLHCDTRATVAITFLLSLPILLLLIGAIVQYAMLVNARLTLDRAVAAAGRSAMTSLPIDPLVENVNGAGNVARATLMTLATQSPAAPFTTSDSQTVANALRQLGVQLPSDFSNRYAHAAAATSITWVPITPGGDVIPNAGLGPYPRVAAPRIRLTITYDYRLDVPAINMLAGLFVGQDKTVGGVPGNYFTLSSTLDVQLSDGREVPTNDQGNP